MSALPIRPIGKIGAVKGSAQGFGAMQLPPGFKGEAKPGDDELAVEVIRKALELGITLINTADFYGPRSNQEQIGLALKGVPREKFVIASKWGPNMDNPHAPGGHSPESCMPRVEESCKRLGVDCIDILILRSLSPAYAIEDVVAAMAECVKAGKVKALGLSEIGPDDIRRAHKVHPISVIEAEWSLMTRDIEVDLLPVCRELGIAILAYSPLSRGLLCANFDPDNLQFKGFPRFQGEALQQNLKLVEDLKKIAARKGCTPSQLALSWVHHQGEDVFPIPGTKTASRLDENVGAFAVKMTKEEVDELAAAFPPDKVAGDRYPGMQNVTYHYSKK